MSTLISYYCLLFHPSQVFFVSPEQSWSCELVELEAVCRRRYQLQDTALEFFRDSGESHLLVFQSAGLAQEVAAALGRAGVPSKLRTSNLAATTKLWCQGRITNFQVGNLRNVLMLFINLLTYST